MANRYVLLGLGCVWLAAAAFVGVATIALVQESGWAELPVFAWFLLVIIFGVAVPLLLYGGYRSVIRPGR